VRRFTPNAARDRLPGFRASAVFWRLVIAGLYSRGPPSCQGTGSNEVPALLAAWPVAVLPTLHSGCTPYAAGIGSLAAGGEGRLIPPRKRSAFRSGKGRDSGPHSAEGAGGGGSPKSSRPELPPALWPFPGSKWFSTTC